MVEVVWTQRGLVFHSESREKALKTPTAVSWVLTWATKHYAVNMFILVVQVQD